MRARSWGWPGSPARARARCCGHCSMRRGADGRAEIDGSAALVAGDRQTDGIFPLWSIAENISIGSLRR